MTKSLVLEKAFDFALRIIKLNRYLVEEKKEYVLSKEVLVSGTHIGKHIKEAISAESRTVFINEMAIARRMASATEYWLQLLFHADRLNEKEFDSLESDRVRLIKMLTSIVNTSKKDD